MIDFESLNPHTNTIISQRFASFELIFLYSKFISLILLISFYRVFGLIHTWTFFTHPKFKFFKIFSTPCLLHPIQLYGPDITKQWLCRCLYARDTNSYTLESKRWSLPYRISHMEFCQQPVWETSKLEVDPLVNVKKKKM